MQTDTTTNCHDCPAYRNSLFRYVSPENLTKIKKYPQQFKKGSYIFHRSESASNLHCIQSGRVQLFRTGTLREQTFSVAESGTWVGCRDVISSSTYQHDARCLNATVACRIEKQTVSNLLETEKNLEFVKGLVQYMATGWRDAEYMGYNLGTRKVMERLADFLLKVNENNSSGENPATIENISKEVDFPFTREIVATIIGTTTESVIRTFSDFKSRGWIDFTRGKLKLNNINAIKNIVDSS